MKKVAKFAGILFLAVVGVVVGAPSQDAEAQILYGFFCCDSAGYRRCTINPGAPIGVACFCPGQGGGWVCG